MDITKSLDEIEARLRERADKDVAELIRYAQNRLKARLESVWKCKMAAALLDAAGYAYKVGGYDSYRLVVDLGVQPRKRPRKARREFDLRMHRLWSGVLRHDGQKERGLEEKDKVPLDDWEVEGHPQLKNHARFTYKVKGWEGVVEVVLVAYLGRSRATTPDGRKCRVVEEMQKVRKIVCEV